MTEQIKKKLRDEIDALEHELIHELPKEIKKAAALGDLSENAEYHMAKQRQEFVKARVRQLGKRLADLSMVNMNNIPKDKVGLGSTVKVYDNTKDAEVEYNLVTSEETDAPNGKISTSSPIGRALLNKEVGDVVKVQIPGGLKELEVLKLTTIHEAEAGNPEPDHDEGHPPTLAVDQPPREQRHQERTEPGTRQSDSRRNPAIAVEPGLHGRNRGRVADRQTEAKAQPERDIGFPNPPDCARCNE